MSRALADQGHYPAIDIEASISRALTSLVDTSQFEFVRRFKSLYSRYQRNRDLVSVGAYNAGSDPLLDQALALYPRMESFLQQNVAERATYEASIDGMRALLQTVKPA
jgi:flagellum-specific ATP synthase